MFEYKKILEFPVHITKPDVEFASVLINAIGGAAGELNSGLSYFMQAATMPDLDGKNLLFTIATEELSHVEILYAMINQLTKNANDTEFIKNDSKGYAERKKGIYPTNAHGLPYRCEYLSSTGDCLADLSNDMAAEEKARAGYEALMNMTNNPEILAPLSFLRQREIVHFERFKELYDRYKKNMKSK